MVVVLLAMGRSKSGLSTPSPVSGWWSGRFHVVNTFPPGTTLRVVITFVVVLLVPGAWLIAAIYWTSRSAQQYRQRVEAESGENFENKTSLGLPFTSRW
jgi:hypothetical protein